MEAGAGLDVQDFDGWTPLHAAAHWGQEEACKVLAENLCNMDLKTNNVSAVVVVVLLVGWPWDCSVVVTVIVSLL